uniref:Uncharacterized protein n=1 Tax=Dunaliella tertiolecta TaxID=3047 RepID=A0A6S8NSP5_DUNTE
MPNTRNPLHNNDSNTMQIRNAQTQLSTLEIIYFYPPNTSTCVFVTLLHQSFIPSFIQFIGPFQVIEILSVKHRLKLPSTMKCHDVFNAPPQTCQFQLKLINFLTGYNKAHHPSSLTMIKRISWLKGSSNILPPLQRPMHKPPDTASNGQATLSMTPQTS